MDKDFLGFDDSYLFTGLSPDAVKFLKINHDQLQYIFTELVQHEERCSISADVVKGDLRSVKVTYERIF